LQIVFIKIIKRKTIVHRCPADELNMLFLLDRQNFFSCKWLRFLVH